MAQPVMGPQPVTLFVSGLPKMLHDADFSQLFSQSGCIASRLGKDGGGMCVPCLPPPLGLSRRHDRYRRTRIE
jgi:hypothetical protein